MFFFYRVYTLEYKSYDSASPVPAASEAGCKCLSAFNNISRKEPTRQVLLELRPSFWRDIELFSVKFQLSTKKMLAFEK